MWWAVIEAVEIKWWAGSSKLYAILCWKEVKKLVQQDFYIVVTTSVKAKLLYVLWRTKPLWEGRRLVRNIH